jgi:hypothetical protein
MKFVFNVVLLLRILLFGYKFILPEYVCKNNVFIVKVYAVLSDSLWYFLSFCIFLTFCVFVGLQTT